MVDILQTSTGEAGTELKTANQPNADTPTASEQVTDKSKLSAIGEKIRKDSLSHREDVSQKDDEEDKAQGEDAEKQAKRRKMKN